MNSCGTSKAPSFPGRRKGQRKDVKLRDAARALLAERLDRILPEYLKQ